MSSPGPITRGRILKVDLDRFPDEPIHRRIYLSIRRDIVDGLLTPGSHLPSTRQLSSDLRVARGTVVIAYDQLRVEGYLEAEVGAGTRVTAHVPDLCMRAETGSPPHRFNSETRRASRRGQVALEELERGPLDVGAARSPRAFRSTPPAIDVFPVDTWTRIASRQWRRATTKDLSYGDPMGFLPLRRVIAEYVRSTRGVRCVAEQILIVGGAQQGMDVAARALTEPGDAVWMEDPGYFGMRGVLRSVGARVVPVGVDFEGIDVSEGKRLAPNARMAFVTPTHQMPLSVPLSARRREELLAWASEADAWIFEDDYNSDFQYATRPIAALHAADREGRVVFCGTFSKSLFPGLRLAYLVVPESVVRELKAIRFFSDIQQSYIDQATLCEFIADGHYERHIRRLRSIYQGRRDLLFDGLRQCGSWLEPTRHDSGREVTVWLNPRLSDVEVAKAAASAGLTVMPLTPWVIAHRIAPSLRLGYSGIDEHDISAGVSRFARVLDLVSRRNEANMPQAS
jgi:GntR family transcriptional regulator / MocR family aminotransferase